MIVKFDDIEVVDNTNEINKNSLFLKTYQNSKYLNQIQTKKIKIIDSNKLQYTLGLNDIKVVGITGTNGKTTTAAAIYSFLLDLGFSVALQGTRGFYINGKKIEGKSLTTPPILQTISHMYEAKKEGCDYLIMEVSSHAIEQKRIEGLEFALKVFTNISQDHLDYHKSMEAYRSVKSSFFQDDTKKLINKDGGKIDFNIKNARSYSIEYPATYKIEAYSLNNGLDAVIKYFDEFATFHSPLVGLFNLYNITAAIASVHMISNSSLEEIADVVENFAGVAGRMQVVCNKPLIVVDFAHTPDGIQKVLESVKDKELSVVFGAGGDRDKSKRAQMGKVVSRFAKKIYITSDNPRSEEPLEIINDIIKGVDNSSALIIPDRKKAIIRALKELKSNEALFVLGKGDEEFQEINGKKIPFSDVKTIEEYFST